MTQQKTHQLLMLFLTFCVVIAIVLLITEPIVGVLWVLLVTLVMVVLMLSKPALWQAEKVRLQQIARSFAGGEQEDAAPGVVYELVVMRPQGGQRFAINGKSFLIGRGGDCDIQLTQCASVGREHCRIVYREHSQEFYIEDLRSRNGTYLGTRRLEPNTQVKLLENEEIVLGDYCLRFQRRM